MHQLYYITVYIQLTFVYNNPKQYVYFQKAQKMSTSPAHKLAQKFSIFSKNLQREKTHKQQQLSKQLQELSQKLSQCTSTNQQMYSQLKDRVVVLRQQVQVVEQNRRDTDRSVGEEMIKIQDQFRGEIQAEKIKCKEEIQEWTKFADAKLLGVCHSMQDSTSENQDNVEAITEKLTLKINTLQDTLSLQKKKREDCINQLTQTIEKELERLYGELEVNKKQRESASKKISKMVSEIEQKLQQELEDERRARKNTNKALLSLLEETCLKIQKAFY